MKNSSKLLEKKRSKELEELEKFCFDMRESNY